MQPDDKLSRLLQAWRQSVPPAAPHFNAGVWARIEARGAPGPFDTLLRLFSHPAVAAALIALCALGGFSWGVYQKDYLQPRLVREQMVEAYVRSIDPLQMMSTTPGP